MPCAGAERNPAWPIGYDRRRCAGTQGTEPKEARERCPVVEGSRRPAVRHFMGETQALLREPTSPGPTLAPERAPVRPIPAGTAGARTGMGSGWSPRRS